MRFSTSLVLFTAIATGVFHTVTVSAIPYGSEGSTYPPSSDGPHTALKPSVGFNYKRSHRQGRSTAESQFEEQRQQDHARGKASIPVNTAARRGFQDLPPEERKQMIQDAHKNLNNKDFDPTDESPEAVAWRYALKLAQSLGDPRADNVAGLAQRIKNLKVFKS
ncbi:hypothetical protein BC835DRAFT_1317679 [Cytidiella melzeri]|nr:hypothetical protein BC835DRAFT_1317679 [Cytidiella melzeri]